MSPKEWSQKAKLQRVAHGSDNDQKHYLLSGQFWEHFQLLREETFVKLETLACWHRQWIHNARVSLREERTPHPSKESSESGRNGLSSKPQRSGNFCRKPYLCSQNADQHKMTSRFDHILHAKTANTWFWFGASIIICFLVCGGIFVLNLSEGFSSLQYTCTYGCQS